MNRAIIDRFYRRLHSIGCDVVLHGNYPWVYLHSINGVRVTEKFRANHGFTAFMVGVDGTQMSDRREVFKLIRRYLEEQL